MFLHRNFVSGRPIWTRSRQSQPHTTLDNRPILLSFFGAYFTGHFLSEWPLALIARSHVLLGASAPAFVYADARPSLSIRRDAVEQGAARLN